MPKKPKRYATPLDADEPYSESGVRVEEEDEEGVSGGKEKKLGEDDEDELSLDDGKDKDEIDDGSSDEDEDY